MALLITLKVLFMCSLYVVIVVFGNKYLKTCSQDTKKNSCFFDFAEDFVNPKSPKEDVKEDKESIGLNISLEDFHILATENRLNTQFRMKSKELNRKITMIDSYIKEDNISSDFYHIFDSNLEVLKTIRETLGRINASFENDSSLVLTQVQRTLLNVSFDEFEAIVDKLNDAIEKHAEEVKETFLQKEKELADEYTELYEETKKKDAQAEAEIRDFYDSLRNKDTDASSNEEVAVADESESESESKQSDKEK